MTRVFWSKAAKTDLDLIWTTVATFDLAAAADRIVEAVEDRITLLRNFPEIGSPAHYGTSKLSLGRLPYVLCYMVAGGTIRILAINHMARGQG